MTRCTIEPRSKKYVKGYGLLSFESSLSNKYERQLLNAATKTGLNALRTATKKAGSKAAEAKGGFTGNKIANKIVKPKSPADENSKNVEEIIIPPEKREEMWSELR